MLFRDAKIIPHMPTTMINDVPKKDDNAYKRQAFSDRDNEKLNEIFDEIVDEINEHTPLFKKENITLGHQGLTQKHPYYIQNRKKSMLI